MRKSSLAVLFHKFECGEKFHSTYAFSDKRQPLRFREVKKVLTLRMLLGARLGQVGGLLPPDQGPIRPQEFRGSQAQGLEALPPAWL
ncbi:hypothetical protein XAC3218_800013 [Xanthomonas citri pv. citri]|nr:hypothetical protein XAC3218_800013 [Xanthomonas citri pv. citri]CEI11966.1 hypothetical protein XACB302_7250012 [Xanthomonas citri pv. citri]